MEGRGVDAPGMDPSPGLVARHGVTPTGTWSAPGRANLIGEHTDYNEGLVLPFAIDRRVVVAAGLRSDGRCSVSTEAGTGVVEVDVADVLRGDPAALRARGWAAYPLGVARMALVAAGAEDAPGVALHVASSVPPGAGLSSSAALECATALALDDLWGLGLDRVALAAAGRRAEGLVVGAPTGPMDQIASLEGRAGAAVLLDCRTLVHRTVSLHLDAAGLAALVVDTGRRHDLADGAYAARRRECEEAAARLGVSALRDLGPADLPDLEGRLDAVHLRRVRHVVTENARVVATVAAVERGDPGTVGPLLDASHASLRDDFEVSTAALDLVAEAARRAGAVGARLTGAGFGGSVLALVQAGEVERVSAAAVGACHRAGLDRAGAFVVRPSDGAHRERPSPGSASGV